MRSTVKEVKDKQLPDVDEDFAVDAGFDDVRSCARTSAGDLWRRRSSAWQEEFREAALDAAVASAQRARHRGARRARAREMWERMLHSLSHRGISREGYLQIAGRAEEEILAEMTPEAERALRREAVLTAVVAAEGIEPSEEDLLEALTPTAEREGIAPRAGARAAARRRGGWRSCARIWRPARRSS